MAGAEGQIRIGLTISGAIALGAYEAGALAALLAAAQAVNEDEPGALRIDAMAGASAGSITALLAARTLLGGLDPIDVMYRAWVTTPQLDQLCDRRDSPLTVAPTRAASENLLRADEHVGRAQRTPIRVNMALGCLHGLDYSIRRIAGPPVNAMTYLDWAEWEIDAAKDLAWYLAPSGPLDSALASGAHAAAFPPYGLDRSAPAIREGYQQNGIEDPPRFLWYTDGGTIDNQPLGRALGLTQEIDEHDPLGQAGRLHLMITPDPAAPHGSDDRWSAPTPVPTWTRTGLRTVKLLRSQRLYDDLREVEKTNSRIEWTRLLERALLTIMSGEAPDAATALKDVTAKIAEQREALAQPGDLRQATDGEPDSELHAALRDALNAATGLSKKRDVAVAVVSPLILPEVADGSQSPGDLLAGDFLGHFGGFIEERLRQSDFELGYRCMTHWLSAGGGLAQYGLDARLAELALTGARQARDVWSGEAGRASAEGLGATTLNGLPLRRRLKVYGVALRSVLIAFRQIRQAAP